MEVKRPLVFNAHLDDVEAMCTVDKLTLGRDLTFGDQKDV